MILQRHDPQAADRSATMIPFPPVVLRHHSGEHSDLGGLTTAVRAATCLSTGRALTFSHDHSAPARLRLDGLPATWAVERGPQVVRLELETAPDKRPQSSASRSRHLPGAAAVSPTGPWPCSKP